MCTHNLEQRSAMKECNFTADGSCKICVGTCHQEKSKREDDYHRYKKTTCLPS